MPKYVAFLRAINVGGHVVKMERLRRLFEEMGFSNVETFITSGNVIFDSSSKSTAAIEKKIEKYLEAKLGYAVVTFVRSTAAVAKLAGYDAFPKENRDGITLYIGFLTEPLSKQTVENLYGAATELDLFHVRDTELFWLCRAQKLSDSKFLGPLLERTLGARTTLRNANTIRRLAAKYQ